MPGISVSIVAGKDKNSSSVKVSGEIQHIITDEERNTFKLNDDQLKSAVEKYFGARPYDAYLHSPTPWGDLYKRYNWPQTRTVISATSAEVLSVTSEPQIIKTQELKNESNKDVTYNVSISDTISDTTTSTWNTGGQFSVDQTIEYEVGFLGTKGGKKTKLSYSESWGNGRTKSKQVTVGSSFGLSVTLKPGKKLKAKLIASHGVMKVHIRYQAHLTGHTAVNYGGTYRGDYFWGLDMPDVMSKSGVSNGIESTEDIELGYFSNGKIIVYNEDSEVMAYKHVLNEKCGD